MPFVEKNISKRHTANATSKRGVVNISQVKEASRARSDEEFTAKIDLCCQEADETQLWLELLRDDCGIAPALTDPIWKESDELISIFVTMSKNTKRHRA